MMKKLLKKLERWLEKAVDRLNRKLEDLFD